MTAQLIIIYAFTRSGVSAGTNCDQSLLIEGLIKSLGMPEIQFPGCSFRNSLLVDHEKDGLGAHIGL